MPTQTTNQRTLDTQQIEVLGRNFLTDQMVRGGLEVAAPLRDRGVDLIIYADLLSEVDRFTARPVQVKVASKRSFSIDKKYERIADLLLIFVWHTNSEEEPRVFALSYAEAVKVADQLGWTQTESWVKGSYSTTSPSKRIEELMDPYLMTPKNWYSKLTGGVTLRL